LQSGLFLHQYKGSHPRESTCKMLTFPQLMMQNFIVMLVISQQDSASVCFSLNIWDNYVIGLEDVPLVALNLSLLHLFLEC
jgi:hypothetical protein